MPIRLQKFLAESGAGSRRHCEELIQASRVSVNGRVVTALGTKIDPSVDHVVVDGREVAAQRKVYIALNKPVGTLCTSRDTHQRERVLDLLPASLPRLYTVGRLDKDTEGLLFLTNDGNFSLRLTHPRYNMSKTYWVEVEGRLKSADIRRLLKGVGADGEVLRADKVYQVRRRARTTALRIVLHEGKKRQVRRMMASVGHRVNRLVRLIVGSVCLGNLKTGQWRYLSHEEILKLMGSSSKDLGS